jgi:hypothetical protein
MSRLLTHYKNGAPSYVTFVICVLAVTTESTHLFREWFVCCRRVGSRVFCSDKRTLREEHCYGYSRISLVVGFFERAKEPTITRDYCTQQREEGDGRVKTIQQRLFFVFHALFFPWLMLLNNLQLLGDAASATCIFLLLTQISCRQHNPSWSRRIFYFKHPVPTKFLTRAVNYKLQDFLL